MEETFGVGPTMPTFEMFSKVSFPNLMVTWSCQKRKLIYIFIGRPLNIRKHGYSTASLFNKKFHRVYVGTNTTWNVATPFLADPLPRKRAFSSFTVIPQPQEFEGHSVREREEECRPGYAGKVRVWESNPVVELSGIG